MRAYSWCRSLWALGVLLAPALLAAAPVVPESPDTVLEELPDLALRARRLPAERLPDALEQARALISLGQREGDPRYFGYAQGLLAPWWSRSDPPPEVRLLRATVLQNAHQFEAALVDLDALLAADPSAGDSLRAQALLTRAMVQTVLARYPAALASCAALEGLVRPLLVAACSAHPGSLYGRADQAYRGLARRYAADVRSHRVDPVLRIWVATLLAEIAERTGRQEEAEEHFADALAQSHALGQRDVYLLAAYADFLLRERSFIDALALLRDHADHDGLLLRLGLAEQALDMPELASHVADLRERFEASRARGSNQHQSAEARFRLELTEEPERALALATEHWRHQRQPSDARVFLEAAAAVGDPEAAAPVLRWMRENRIEDRHLRALAERLRPQTPPASPQAGSDQTRPRPQGAR